MMLNLGNAKYELQIDEANNTIYLTSWDNKITLENADKYLSWLNLSINSWTITDNNTWSQQDVTLTWNTVDSWNVISTWTRVLGENIDAELSTWNEFDKALYWMYKNWLTKYDNSEDFRPYDNLTREESAKMIWQLYSILWFSKEDKWFNCSFVDTNIFDPTLAEHIYNVCRRWIFRWNDKTQQYMPRDNLTKGQLLAVLLRIFE